MPGETSPQGIRDPWPQELGRWDSRPDNGLEPSKEQGETLQGVAEFCGQVLSNRGGGGSKARLPEAVHMVLGGALSSHRL